MKTLQQLLHLYVAWFVIFTVGVVSTAGFCIILVAVQQKPFSFDPVLANWQGMMIRYFALPALVFTIISYFENRKQFKHLYKKGEKFSTWPSCKLKIQTEVSREKMKAVCLSALESWPGGCRFIKEDYKGYLLYAYTNPSNYSGPGNIILLEERPQGSIVDFLITSENKLKIFPLDGARNLKNIIHIEDCLKSALGDQAELVKDV